MLPPGSVARRRYIFSTRTDAWTFGILLWEMFSLGQAPTCSVATELRQPDYAGRALYELMRRCWALNSSERITFMELYDYFNGMLEGHCRPPDLEVPALETGQDNSDCISSSVWLELWIGFISEIMNLFKRIYQREFSCSWLAYLIDLRLQDLDLLLEHL